MQCLPGDSYRINTAVPLPTAMVPQTKRTPVDALPPEILVCVFLYCSPLKESEYHRVLNQLSLVSKRWYEVIESSPSLWTLIHVDYHRPLIKRILQRSKNSSLRIIWPSGTPCRAVLLDLLSPHIHRCYELSCHGEDLTPWQPLLRQSNERLTYLTLHSLHFPSKVAPGYLTLEIGRGGPIRSVDLIGVHVYPWSSPRLTSLTCLNLRGVPNPPSFTEIVRMLSNSPNLRQLKLWCTKSPAPKQDGEEMTVPLLQLHDLEDMVLESLHPTFYHRLIPKLIIPRCSRISIIIRPIDIRGHTQGGLISQTIAPGSSFMQTVTSICEKADCFYLDYAAHGPSTYRVGFKAKSKNTVIFEYQGVEDNFNLNVASTINALVDNSAPLALCIGPDVGMAATDMKSLQSVTSIFAESTIFVEFVEFLSRSSDGVFPMASLSELLLIYRPASEVDEKSADMLYRLLKQRWATKVEDRKAVRVRVVTAGNPVPMAFERLEEKVRAEIPERCCTIRCGIW